MRVPFALSKRSALLSLTALAASAAVLGMLPRASGIFPQGTQPLSAILLVLGLAFLVTWAVGKLGKRVQGAVGLGCPVPIQVTGVKALGQGKTLLVVEVEGERFLLSSGKDGVELLARLGDARFESREQDRETRE